MYWNIEDLKNKLSQINERIKNEKDEKALLTLRVDAEILNEMISYISYPYVINNDFEYSANLIFRSNINQTGEFIVDNQSKVFELARDLSQLPRLSASLVINKKISNDEYFDLVDKFFKKFDSEHSRLYREMISSSKIELNPKEYSFGGNGIAHHLNTFGTNYVASRFDGTMNFASTLPHEVGHAHQLDGVSDIDIDVNLSYSLFEEAYPDFIKYAFYDFLKNTKYRKFAFEKEWSMLDEFSLYVETNCKFYSTLSGSEFREHEFHFDDGSKCSTVPFSYLYSNLYALYFLNLYRKDKMKCMDELNKFNDLVGRVSDEEIIGLYNNESLINSIREVGHDYSRTYRRR